MSVDLVYVLPGSPLVDVARELFLDYQRELGVDLCFQGFEAELAGLPGKYSLPDGALLVAVDGSEPVGCAAFRPFADGVCELKRFYVSPSRRRTGIAGELLAKLLNQARKSGYERVILDTLERLGPANEFYLKHGFHRVDPYYDNPEADVVFFGRRVRPEAVIELQPFLDMDGRVTQMPAGKGSDRVIQMVLDRMVPLFGRGVKYTEKEVNALLNTQHTFSDPATLRRMLVDRGDLARSNDCTEYWKT